LREPAVLKATGYGPTQLDELIKQRKFPAPIALSPGGKAKGWFEDEIIAYQEARAAERDAGLAAKRDETPKHNEDETPK
jgi:predicted DNA-binding transcriptional regulator AlpA